MQGELHHLLYPKRLRAKPANPATSQGTATLTTRAPTWRQSYVIVVESGFYPDKAKISDAYMHQWLPVAEQQLRLGGARLAIILNRIFDTPR